jgi:hypothetical protein
MAVNTKSWRRLPVADRDQAFSADDSFVRCAEWAKGSAEQLNSLFLWRDPQGSPGNKNSYRLPIADIIDGRPYLIPHAVFTAAAFLSNKGQGAHGGLVGVVGEQERLQLQKVVTEIYKMLSDLYNDPRVKPSWLRGGDQEENVTASVNTSGWSSMPVADTSRPWDGAAAKARLWSRADGDMREYRRGFLWWDQDAPENKGSYKLPIADVVDGELTIVPRAVNAVVAVLGGARGGVDIPDSDMDNVESIAKRIQARFSDEDDSNAQTAAAAPVAPPAHWFQDPQLQAPTPIAVTADGRVMGHLAAWGVCHASFGNKCVMAPHSAVNYKYFLNGSVLTADGSIVKIGKITLGTGHADIRLGWIPAADHYDNTGTAVAVVAAGEDRHGIWVAGAMVPEASDETMAQLRRSPLSGDWRRINGNLELVAALAVNTPGFPIVNMSASGEPDGLVAAGVILEDGSVMASEEPEPVTTPDAKVLARLDDIQAYVDKLVADRRKRRYNTIMGEK